MMTPNWPLQIYTAFFISSVARFDRLDFGIFPRQIGSKTYRRPVGEDDISEEDRGALHFMAAEVLMGEADEVVSSFT